MLLTNIRVIHVSSTAKLSGRIERNPMAGPSGDSYAPMEIGWTTAVTSAEGVEMQKEKLIRGRMIARQRHQALVTNKYDDGGLVEGPSTWRHDSSGSARAVAGALPRLCSARPGSPIDPSTPTTNPQTPAD